MTKQIQPTSLGLETTKTNEHKLNSSRSRRKGRKLPESSDVLVSAVISSYLLTHLHHLLQRAEFGAAKEGRKYHAKNFAELRKVLCLDARSMADASAKGLRDGDTDQLINPQIRSDAA